MTHTWQKRDVLLLGWVALAIIAWEWTRARR